LFARSLELSGYVVLECDESLCVRAQHGAAEGPVKDGRLRPELEAAVQAQLAGETRTSPYARTGSPEFRLVQVDRNADGTLLVWLRHHAQSRALFSRQLRERYGFKLRSQQLLTLLAQGLKNREIAEQLGLREATVKTYLHEVYETLGVKSRTQAIAELRRTVQLEQL
jgi:DNA-binding NarL/FixJ family response regulator